MLSRKPSPAMLVALLALFVALGGSSYAALTLPRGSVGGKQLKKNAVTSPKVKRGSLLLSDFRASHRSRLRGAQGIPGQQGAQGAQGEKGEKGDRGLAGTARAYALVHGDSCALMAACGIPKTKAVAYAIRVGVGIFCVGVTGIDASAADSVAVVTWAEEGVGGMARWRSDNNACVASEFEVLTSYAPGGSTPTAADSADFSIVIP